jgi:hypothetical protein
MNRAVSLSLLVVILIIPIALAGPALPAGAGDPTPVPPPDLPSGANGWIATNARVRLRTGPGFHYPSLATLDPQTPLRVIALHRDFDNNEWFLARVMDGRFGWVAAGLVQTSGNAPAPIDPLPPTGTQPAPLPPEIELPDGVVRHAQTIYAIGRALGNRPDAFIILGDSTSAGNEFTLPAFCAYRWGAYDLGPYGYLQTIVATYAYSFCVSNLTLRSGFSTDHLLDPTWADPLYCEDGETPLECEVRRRRPAVALIYIGLVDITYSTPARYAENLTFIVRYLVGQGVIPVLHTVPGSDRVVRARGYEERMAELNAIVRDIAARNRLPVLDLQTATRDLPNQGTVEEGFHLSYRVDGVVSFSGDEQIYGKDLRELLTLQLLYELRRTVIVDRTPVG